MSLLLRLAGFALLLGFAVAALAPAALIGPEVTRASGGALMLVETEGTVWRGRATLVAGGGRIPLAWQVEPAALLGGELAVRLTGQDAARASPRARLVAGRDRVAVTDVDIALPAAAFAVASGAGATVVPGGMLRVRAASIQRRADGFVGGFDLDWEDARIRVVATPQSFDLGSVAVAFTGSGDRLHGPVTNRGGRLALSGEAGIDAHGAATLDLQVTPRVPPDPGTASTLGALGRPEGPGWRLQWPVRAR